MAKKPAKVKGLMNEVGRFRRPIGELPGTEPSTKAGENQLRIAVTQYKGRVVVSFGKRIEWLGCSTDEATLLANSILAKVMEIKDRA